MTRSTMRIAAAVLCGVLTGCGQSTVPVAQGPGARPVHDGQLEFLPDGKGAVELIVEPSGSQGKVVAYFTRADGSGPPDPAPSAVSFVDPSGKALPLTPDARSKSARFVSKPAAFQPGRGVEGTLKANLGGGVQVPFRKR